MLGEKLTVSAMHDRFEKFVRRLYGSTAAADEGAAALPTTIAETIRALDPRALQSVARSTLATAPFLHALEEAQIPNTWLRYVLVHDEIGPAGFLLLTIVRLDLTRVIKGAVAGADSKRRRAIGAAGTLLTPSGKKGEAAIARIIMGGHPLFYGNHFFDFRDLEPTPSLLATIVRAAYRIRIQEGISVSLLKDFTVEDIARLSPLERYGYVRFETQPCMILQIDPRWKTFGGYMASLSGKHRKQIRDNRRIFESKKLSIERARPTPIAAELAELYANVWNRPPARIATLTPSFFRAVEDHLRDAFRLWVVRKDHRIIAFICAINDRVSSKGQNRLLGVFVGLDYRLNEEYRLYPNLLYRLIEEAIVENFDLLDLGRTSSQVKADLGAQPEKLHCFLRHRHPSKNALMRALFEQIVRPARSPDRLALR